MTQWLTRKNQTWAKSLKIRAGTRDNYRRDSRTSLLRMCHDQHLHVAVVTERKMDKVMNLKSEIFTCSTWATQTFRSCLHYYWLRCGSFSRARKFLKRFLSDMLYSELAIPSAGRIFLARSLSRYWCDIPDIWLFVFVQCCACKVNRQPWISTLVITMCIWWTPGLFLGKS